MSPRPPVTWYGSHPNNFSVSRRPRTARITRIVIHMAEGSWSGTLNWFQGPRAGVSAHYTVRSSNGRIGQSVKNKNIAYHAGNWRINRTSIGIEHEGYSDNPAWVTEAMLRSSAKLTAHLCRRYGIPINRRRIIGHYQVRGGTRSCPGNAWWWRRYMNLVRRYARR